MNEEHKKHYIIYKITNLINGKFYVGQHQTFNLDDGYMGSSDILNNAIKKYGIENFKKEILKEYETFDEMNLAESIIVDKDFVARSDTYNISVGGTFGWENCNKALRNNEEKDSLRKLHVAEGVRRWAANLSKEDHERLSKKAYETRKKHPESFDIRGSKNPMFGKTHTLSARKRLSKTHIGSQNSQYGKHWWKDPNDKTKSLSIKEGDPVPEGWVRGKWPTEKEIANQISKNKGKHFKAITNGINTKFIEYDGISTSSIVLPIGWRFGSTSKGAINFHWITNGKERKFVDKTLEIPDGWYKGMK